MAPKLTYKTANGLELLTDWENYETQKKTAIKGVKALLPCLEIITGGDKHQNIEYLFGLPYTSSSDFAALWNTNAVARFCGCPLFFKGVALSVDNLPVAIFIEVDGEGNEVETHYKILC